MEFPSVVVLMSTYNGEKYIREQIESILAQEGVHLQLQIRDDGSSDRTLDICYEYAKRNANISIYAGTNIGVGKSFLELLRQAPEAGYYSFADQDDVWQKDKLKRAIYLIHLAEQKDLSKDAGKGKTLTEEQLNSGENSGANKYPILYGSNQTLVDEELNVCSTRFETMPKCDLFPSISRNVMYGCTMVMNCALKNKISDCNDPDDIILSRKNHDGWVLYISHISGIVIYDKESHIYYRQHNEQVVGVKQANGIKKVQEKIHRLINKSNQRVRSRLAKELLSFFADEMDPSNRMHLETLSKANTFRGAMNLIKDPILVDSFGESRRKIVFRGIIRWI